MPQSLRHHLLCLALLEILRAAVSGKEHTIGADQYVYYRARNPKRCLAPDVFVKLGVPQGEDFDSWMTWERGAPDVAFEVLSPSDSYERWTLRQKIERYTEMGVKELYLFNVDAKAGVRLRAWDRRKGDFVERVVKKEKTQSRLLGLELYLDAVAVFDREYPIGLRARRSGVVAPTMLESKRAAEARVAELEAEVARLRARR